MSGIVIKIGIYGLLRVTFDLLQGQLWWWGVLALVLGLATALFGVLFATVQTDMKRLLAYSSIENIGIIVAGIGLAILFKSYDKTLLAAIALTASLYHALNHAFFKSLLFLATGSVLHATKERSLGKLGGLIHRMPWVAWLALAGTLACAGLPPLNGFVSEWLLLQAFLFTPSLPQSFVNMLVPLAAAALVLAAALAAYVMVKFYGVIFLGRPREPNRTHRAGLVRRRLPAAGPIPRPGHRVSRCGQCDAARCDGEPAGHLLVAAGANRHRSRQLQPGDRIGRYRERAAAYDPGRASPVSRAPAQGPGVGLRLSRADAANAGYGRGLRPTDPADLRAIFPHRTHAAHAIRCPAEILRQGG